MSLWQKSGSSMHKVSSATRITIGDGGVNMSQRSQRATSRRTTRDPNLQGTRDFSLQSKISVQSRQSQRSRQSQQSQRPTRPMRRCHPDQDSLSQPSQQSVNFEGGFADCPGPAECPTRLRAEAREKAKKVRKSRFSVPESCVICETDEESSEFNWLDNEGDARHAGDARQTKTTDTKPKKAVCHDTCSVRRQMRRSSVMLPALAEAERTYFELVAIGDAGAVRNFLNSQPGFNVNCTDYQGLTALAIAVGAGDIPMTELLLEHPEIDVGDCSLRAAQTGDTRLLQMLLDKLRSQGEGREYAGCAGSPDYPDGTTALLLAAQQGHYDAIALLLSRGHSLRRPHGPGCKCKEACGPQKLTQDPVALGAARLALYRAWVSPAFLCHSCEDPILEAFLLCKELCQWAAATPPLRPAFTQLAKRARRFSADLMGCCRTASEVETLLRERAGYDYPRAFIFPRLMLAVDLKQKEFVAHPNTQQVLETAWSDEWTDWQSRPGCLKALTVVPRMLLLPVTAAVTIFAPGSSLGHSFALPVSKYLSHCASYLIFLALIFLQSNLDRKHQLRGCPKSGLEPVIVLFTVGHIWGSSRLCLIMGPRRYFSVLRNWYDAVTQLLFVATFLFWLAASFDVKANDQQELERKYWHALDPTLLSEGFFALATILAFGRLLLLLQFSFHLGPLQVSLGKMFKDIAKFLTIFIIVLFAFAAGLCRFYQYYEGMSQRDSWGGTTAQLSSFVSLPHTLKTLFWCIFCMSPLEAADVVIENIPGADGTTIVNTHYFTEAVGHLCFALFMVFSVIVLLNMLIATICNTFQKVTENVDVEWTFGRTEVYLVYLLQTTLPPPLNLLPTAKGLAAVGRWCSLLRKKEEGGPKARWSPGHCCFVEVGPPTEEEQRDYAAVLAQLAQRYFREQENAIEFGPTIPTASDTESLRREIKGLREALIYAVGSDRSPSPGSSIPRGRSPLPKAYIPLPSSSHAGEIESSSFGDEEEGWELATISATGSLNSSRNVTFDRSVSVGVSNKRSNHATTGGRSYTSDRTTQIMQGGRSGMTTIAENDLASRITYGGRSKFSSTGNDRFALSALEEEGNIDFSRVENKNSRSTRVLPGNGRVSFSTSEDRTCIPATRATNERNMFCMPGVGRNILSNERIMLPSRASLPVRSYERSMLPVAEEQTIVPPNSEPNLHPTNSKIRATASMCERKMLTECSLGRNVHPSGCEQKKVRYGRSERIVHPSREIETNPPSGQDTEHIIISTPYAGSNNLVAQGERSVYQSRDTLLPVHSDEQNILMGETERCAGPKTLCPRDSEKFVPSASRDERNDFLSGPHERNTLLSRIEGVKVPQVSGIEQNEDESCDGERDSRISRDHRPSTRSIHLVDRTKHPSHDRECDDIEENPRGCDPLLSHSVEPTCDEQLKSISLRDTTRKARSLVRCEEHTSKYSTQNGRRKARSSEHAGERASFKLPSTQIGPEKRKGRTSSKPRNDEKQSLSVKRYKERPRSTLRTGERGSRPADGERRTRSVVAHAVRASGRATFSAERAGVRVADETIGRSYMHPSFGGMLQPERYPAAEESTSSTTSSPALSPVISSELAIVERSSLSDAVPPTRSIMHSLRVKTPPNEAVSFVGRDKTSSANEIVDPKSPRTRSQSRGKRKCSPMKKSPCVATLGFPRLMNISLRGKTPSQSKSPHKTGIELPRQTGSQFFGEPETEPKFSREPWVASSRQSFPRPRRNRTCKSLHQGGSESHQPEPKSPRVRGNEFSNQPGSNSPLRRGSKSPRQPGCKSPRQPGSKSPRQSGSKSPRQSGSKSPRQSGSKSPRQSGSKSSRQSLSPRQPQARYPCVPTCSRWLSRTGRSNQKQKSTPTVSQTSPRPSSIQRSPRHSSLIQQDSQIGSSTPSPVQTSRRQSSTDRDTRNWSLNQTDSPGRSRAPSPALPHRHSPTDPPPSSLNTHSPRRSRGPSPIPSIHPSVQFQPDTKRQSITPSPDRTSQPSVAHRSRHSSVQSDSKHQSSSPSPVHSSPRKGSSSQARRQASRRHWRRMSGRRTATPTHVGEIARRTVARSLAEGTAVALAARDAKHASMSVTKPSNIHAEGDLQ